MTETRATALGRAASGGLVVMTLMTGLMLLAGCGQKGPLYLPERTPIEIGARENDAVQEDDEDEDRDDTRDPPP